MKIYLISSPWTPIWDYVIDFGMISLQKHLRLMRKFDKFFQLTVVPIGSFSSRVIVYISPKAKKITRLGPCGKWPDWAGSEVGRAGPGPARARTQKANNREANLQHGKVLQIVPNGIELSPSETISINYPDHPKHPLGAMRRLFSQVYIIEIVSNCIS